MGWLTDTLAKRLFLLIWGALVLSHLLAFAAVQLVHFSDRPGMPRVAGQLPTFPSLPPTPGIPDAHRGDARGPDGPGPLPRPRPMHEEEGGPGDGPPPRSATPGLPANILLLDYGVRLLVIALAAWFGSRWLAAPMRRLLNASQTLGEAIDQQLALPQLDEQSGTREVREAAQVFNAMGRQLQQQFKSRGLMIAAISHDLRTPLTRLRMRLECMDAEPELQQRSVADVQEMNALIDNVLEVFRSAGPSAAPEPLQKTDIAALVQSLTDDLIEQGQPVSCSGDAAAVTQAQPAALRRVLGNLIGNALRYGERAEVAVTQSADAVRITIDDHGPGIPVVHLEDVFQPFFRLESSRNKHTGGTGLGLYIARDLTRRQGGRLSLSNRAEGGLRAEIVLSKA